ncbi:MAG TPA: hypothetical protein VNA04_12250 [Thermoanaerobaculia bacterium]|nr:hypothetical protein [Thermoanaerobaculia bacterium]
MRTARDLSLIVLLLVATACTTDRTRRAYLRQNAATLSPPDRVVIVIPGFGVTRLFDPVTKRHVWGTARATVHSGFPEDLDLPPGKDGLPGRDRLVPRGWVGSRGPVNTGWQLTEALRKYGGYTVGETIHPFFYDWRLSARDNAAHLGEMVERVSRGRKVDLVTHSAGAVVALTYVKLAGGGDRVERLIMIAPVQRGVIDAFRLFVRPERFLRRTFSAELVATWPFLYELLPAAGTFVLGPDGQPLEFDAWRAETWPRVSAGHLPLPQVLARARAFRDELAAAPMPAGVRAAVMAGDCVPTARAILRRDDGTFAFYPRELRREEEHLRPLMFEPGDGTVPVSSAAGGGDAQLFCDGHQGIATDPNVHRAMLRALGRDE